MTPICRFIRGERMTIKTVDRKRLWGRSGNRCAICNARLLQETEMGVAVILGEEAHIVAREADGPRGDSPLTAAQRDEYSNLILLCPTDHARIDAMPTGPADYPIEPLLELKRRHEQKVHDALGFDAQAQLNEENWASLIDHFLTRIQLDRWGFFSGNLMDPAGPSMRNDDRKRMADLRDWLISRIWPEGHNHLRELLRGIGEVINDLLLLLERNSEDNPLMDDSVRLAKDYKQLGRWDPEEYKRLLDDYTYNLDLVQNLVLELARFSNAICDAIRAEIDGRFRFDEGVLIVINGPTETFEFERIRPEFRPEDYRGRKHPYPRLEEFKHERFTRDGWLGDKPAGADRP